MTPVDHRALASALLAAARDVRASGWDHPDMLFAIHGCWRNPQLGYILQLPGAAPNLLPELSEMGLRSREYTLGLVLVATAEQVPNLDELLALTKEGQTDYAPQGAMLHAVAAAWGAATGRPLTDDPPRRGQVLLAVLRDGYTAVITNEEGNGVHMAERVPRTMGDHETMAKAVM